jgi:hypothetical protein
MNHGTANHGGMQQHAPETKMPARSLHSTAGNSIFQLPNQLSKAVSTGTAIVPHSTAQSKTPDKASDKATDKAFATMAARFALAGHALVRCHPADSVTPYYAFKWGMIKPLASLDDAQAFLKRIGGAA